MYRWLMVPAGATALHVAAQQQHAAVVLALMQHYALMVRDSSSQRPADPRAWCVQCLGREVLTVNHYERLTVALQRVQTGTADG